MLRLAILFAAAAVLTAQDGATRENWPHYGGQTSAWRYSALDQVNAANVKSLTPVWSFQTGDNEGGLQATPIVIDGVPVTHGSTTITLRPCFAATAASNRVHNPRQAPISTRSPSYRCKHQSASAATRSR